MAHTPGDYGVSISHKIAGFDRIPQKNCNSASHGKKGLQLDLLGLVQGMINLVFQVFDLLRITVAHLINLAIFLQ